MIIAHHRPGDAPALSHLLDLCFGPGRHLRTASLLRAQSAPVPALSFAAHDGVQLIGSVQCWPVRLVHDGGETALTLLGPLAVHPHARGRGLAHRLMHTALWAAERQGAWPMVLIGDPTFYAPMGFDATQTGAWVLPGPVERHRLLTRSGADLPLQASLLPLATDSLRRAA